MLFHPCNNIHKISYIITKTYSNNNSYIEIVTYGLLNQEEYKDMNANLMKLKGEDENG